MRHTIWPLPLPCIHKHTHTHMLEFSQVLNNFFICQFCFLVFHFLSLSLSLSRYLFLSTTHIVFNVVMIEDWRLLQFFRFNTWKQCKTTQFFMHWWFLDMFFFSSIKLLSTLFPFPFGIHHRPHHLISNENDDNDDDDFIFFSLISSLLKLDELSGKKFFFFVYFYSLHFHFIRMKRKKKFSREIHQAKNIGDNNK